MRRLLLAIVTAALVATSCSIETKDFDAFFGEDFSVSSLETAQSSRVFDRNGDLIVELRGEQNRTDVGIEDMAPVLIDAVVAIEDERFWDHSGVDLKAILRAARSNVNAGGIAQGGSTITQQYVGNVFLDRTDQTGARKIEEIFMARRFEEQYTKEFILERYLNWVFFGRNAWGVEAAARTYFGAPDCERQANAFVGEDDRDCLKVSELTLVEAATIAGLIQAPSTFNPFNNYEASRDRRDLVLLRMRANDYITEDEYEQALLQPIDLIPDVPILEEEYPAAHFVEDVKQWFLDNPQFGATREERNTLLFEGGLDIYTTIDLGLQAEAEASVEEVLPQVAADGSLNPDAAAVILGTTAADDGHILAMVGGRDFFAGDDDAKFNLASGPGRQAGSSMKPIGLAAALQIGIPITRFYDATSPIEIENRAVCGPTWRVRGGGGGDRTLATATKFSTNTVYAQLIVDIGPQRFVDMAEALGIGEDRIQPVCAAILGTENTNMVELASVYSTFARDGVRVDPVYVTRIDDAEGAQIYEHIDQREPVLNKTVNDQLTWALTTVVNGGTGWRAALEEWPAAGKTGTSQNNADATFAGYTRQRAAAVWVGYPAEQIPMQTQFQGGKVEGGTFPAMIWHELMTSAMQGFEAASFPDPPGSSTTTTLPVVPEEAVVPNLVGFEANEFLREQFSGEPNYWVLEYVEVETRDHTPGQIFNQVPGAGQVVPGGSLITVEVAVAPELLAVPTVIGLSEAQARQQIAAAGYGVSVVVEEDPDGSDDASGLVWSQDPAAGTLDDTVQIVTVRVNPGEPPPTTAPPTTAPTTTEPTDDGEGDDG